MADRRKTFSLLHLILSLTTNCLQIQTLVIESQMAGKQAKILNDSQLAQLLAYACTTRYPSRNRVIVLLSVKAGLRAGEIAKLTWDMVLDPSGQVSAAIELRDWAAKKKSGRTIPLHDDLATALASWLIETSEFWTCHSFRAGRPDDSDQHRQLV